MFNKPHVVKDPPSGIDRDLVWPERDSGCWGYYTDQSSNSGPIGDWFASHKGIIENLKDKRTCIQAGAACGMYPLFLSNYFEKVICFEPSPNYDFAEYNVRGVENIELFNYSLSDKETTYYMRLNDTNVGMNKIGGEKPAMGDHPTNSIILDKFIDGEDIDLLWFDMEGHEFNALQGSIYLIEAFQPVIGIERPTSEVQDLLNKLGYNRKNAISSKMDTFFFPENY